MISKITNKDLFLFSMEDNELSENVLDAILKYAALKDKENKNIQQNTIALDSMDKYCNSNTLQ